MSLPPSAGVIGWPVAHSKSPLIHRFWLAKLGIDGDYGRFPVAPERLGEALRALPALGLRGVNVTAPHKVAVMAYLDNIDLLAGQAGAVNTVVVGEDGRLTGYNTDIAGVAEPLSALCDVSSDERLATSVRIIGAGGAARGAVLGAREAGYRDFDIFNRSVERAQALAVLAGSPVSHGHPLTALGQIRSATSDFADKQVSRVIINATTMGMTGNDPVPIDLLLYAADTIVFDMVYDPLETPLLAEARRLGMRTIDGLQMLVGQAAAAFALFYGASAPREFDAELRALLTA